jgi:hypothetical protein
VIRSLLFECLLYKQDVPRFLIRAHRHQFLTADFTRGKYRIDGFICPAFQLKTAYANRYTSQNVKPPDVGLLIITVQDDGKTNWQCPMIEFHKEKYEVI